jgi:hypothetical protein
MYLDHKHMFWLDTDMLPIYPIVKVRKNKEILQLLCITYVTTGQYCCTNTDHT